jgi:hypothetical protein
MIKYKRIYMTLNRNFKLLFNYLMIFMILLITTSQNYQLLRDSNYYIYEGVSSIKSNQSTTSIDETTPYGSFVGSATSTIQGEQNYFEWSINTLYGPGFTWYMMNDTEYWDMTALPSTSRSRGNFSYTALLSDEEESASGKFYPLYADTWWFVSINHYTGYSCSVEFTNYWKDDFIKIIAPTSSSSWTINASHFINWTWGGDFAFVDIDLYHDGFFLNNIANNVLNNGFYEWKIPPNISEFDDFYQIRISNSDYPETWNISATYFSIEYPKSITITNPSVANSWKTKELHYITWSSTGDIPNVKIELFNYSTFAIIIIPSTPNDGNFSWTIPPGLEDSKHYQIKISDASNTSIFDYSDHFEITSSAISPNGPPIISGFNLLIVLSTVFGCALIIYGFIISHLRKNKYKTYYC